MIAFIQKYYSMLIVGGVILWSVLSVISYRDRQTPPGTIVVRIAHYQLEAGVRDAFEEMAAEYQKLHPSVRIVQDAIPEPGYAQWVTTQLIGGTAPDIIELHGGAMPRPVLAVYATRYFLNLSDIADAPNPYNKGTDLEKVVLRNTFKDGMRNGYMEEAQRFMAVPLSAQGIKIFYNKELLKRLTGLDEPPTEYRAFLAMCEKIRQQRDATGQPFSPISCSKFHFGQWDSIMFQSLTYGNLRRADFDFDFGISPAEFYAAIRSKRLDLHAETFSGYLKMMRQVSAYFPPGWTGLQRDEAVFRFAQERAPLMSAYTQEAYSLLELAEGKFNLGIADFPIPEKTDPEFGSLVEGPRWEKPDDTFRFAVTRYSDYPEVALDFLLFLASRKQNERLNDIAHWVPCIIGAKTPDFLEKFDPKLEGVIPAFQVAVGVDTLIRWQQLLALFQLEKISFDELMAEFGTFLDQYTPTDFADGRRESRRDLSRDETLAASARINALFAEKGADAAWLRYTDFTRSRLVESDFNSNLIDRIIARGPDAEAVGPYEYTPRALEKIRATLQQPKTPPVETRSSR